MSLKTFLESCICSELANTNFKYLLTKKDILTGKQTDVENVSFQELLDLYNQATRNIYTTVPLLVNRGIIETNSVQSQYKIPDSFIESDELQQANDVVKILGVNNLCSRGHLNEVDCNGIVVNGIDELRFINPVDGNKYEVAYQAVPLAVSEEDLEKPIGIPLSVQDTVKAYIAFKYSFNNPSLSSPDRIVALGQIYNQLVGLLKSSNVQNNSVIYPNTLLEQKGFI